MNFTVAVLSPHMFIFTRKTAAGMIHGEYHYNIVDKFVKKGIFRCNFFYEMLGGQPHYRLYFCTSQFNVSHFFVE